MIESDSIPFDMPDTEMEAQVPEQFTVHDEASANWVVRKIIEARAYAARVKAWAKYETCRARREERFFLQRFGNELDGWIRSQLAAEGGKRESVGLPAGTVGYRVVPAKLILDDKNAAIEWAKLHCPHAVVTSNRLLRQPLNEHLAQTGELPPGVRLDPEHSRFYIK